MRKTTERGRSNYDNSINKNKRQPVGTLEVERERGEKIGELINTKGGREKEREKERERREKKE